MRETSSEGRHDRHLHLGKHLDRGIDCLSLDIEWTRSDVNNGASGVPGVVVDGVPTSDPGISSSYALRATFLFCFCFCFLCFREVGRDWMQTT